METKDQCTYRYVGNGDREPDCRPGKRYSTAWDVAYMSYCPHCGKPIHTPDDDPEDSETGT